MADPFDLDRFVQAQERTYATVLAELRAGRKKSHWIWFIFPQIDGLGHSSTSRFYAIKSRDEARAYLEHPVLGARLRECTEIVVGLDDVSVDSVFGFPDTLKFRSCMTLFRRISSGDNCFARALEKYFGGEEDPYTIRLLGS